MKKPSFIVRKWMVRAMVTVGAALGFSSCNHYPGETVYGPPPSDGSSIETTEDVYGPPVEDLNSVSTVEVVYGPPSDFVDQEVEPVVIDESVSSQEDKKPK